MVKILGEKSNKIVKSGRSSGQIFFSFVLKHFFYSNDVKKQSVKNADCSRKGRQKSDLSCAGMKRNYAVTSAR